MKGNMAKRVSLIVVCMMLLTLPGGATSIAQEPDLEQGRIAKLTIEAGLLSWEPQVENGEFTLTISGPGDWYLHQEFQPGVGPTFKPVDNAGNSLPEGAYRYELRLLQTKGEASTGYDEARRGLAPTEDTANALVLSGSFYILDGGFAVRDVTEGDGEDVTRGPAPLDHVIVDDLIVQGSTCTGFDCVNGYSFGFDTFVLAENNLRIYFKDTSATASFPTNDWRIVANDSANGGASYFGIDDVDGGRRPFTIEAGAPAHSLYVEDYGRIGIGTSVPAVELHISDSDTPTVRLHQNSSGGWTPQVWDVAGNESNFFIRDVTNGFSLPLRIQPGAPSSTLSIKANGRVGIGTWSPDQTLHVEGSDGSTQVRVEETSSTEALRTLMQLVNKGPLMIRFENTSVGEWNFGTSGADRFFISRSGTVERAFLLEGNGNLTINGVLSEGSNLHTKENLATVDNQEILDKIAGIPIASWNFKFDDPEVRHLGPMAQDFYDAFGLGADDEHIASLDVNGVSLAAIQELYQHSQEQATRIDDLEAQVGTLEARLEALEKAIGASVSQ